MSKKDEALKQALEALEVATTPLAKDRQEVLRARAAIREALAEQPAQQEPVAYRVKWPAIGGGYKWLMVDKPLMEKEGFANEALYTSPQAQRTWVGLTPEQRQAIAEANNTLVDDDLFDAIESLLKEKNT